MIENLIWIFGFVGLFITLISFQFKKHKSIMVLRTAQEVIFGIHYLLKGNFTAVAMNTIGSTRNLIFANRVQKGKSTRFMQFFFSVLFVIFGLFTYEGYASILVMFAKVVTTFAYGMKNTSLLRLLTLPTCICWLIYNIFADSVFGIISEVFTIASIITAMIRIDVIPYFKGDAKTNKMEN